MLTTHSTLNIHDNLEGMAILDGKIRFAASGRLELVNDTTRSIGKEEG
jgi:hypothetical protein